MASDSIYTLFITDVDFYKPNPALAAIMAGATGTLGLFLGSIALDVQLLYQGLVNVKSGQLKASAHGFVESRGGHAHDRLVGKVTAGGLDAVGVWESDRNPNSGGEFFYGVLHDLGDGGHPPSGRDFPAYEDLYEALEIYASLNGEVPD